jgi:chromosome segregation ATPase
MLDNIAQSYDHEKRERIDQEFTGLKEPIILLQKMQELDEGISQILDHIGSETIEAQQTELNKIKDKLKAVIERISNADKIEIKNQAIAQIATEVKTQVNARIAQAQQDIENIENALGLLLEIQHIEEQMQQIVNAEVINADELDRLKSNLQTIKEKIPYDNENPITTQIKNKLCEKTKQIEQDIENIKNMPGLLAGTQQIETAVQQIDIESRDVLLLQLEQFEIELQAIKEKVPIDNGSQITIQIRNKLFEKIGKIKQDIENIKNIPELLARIQQIGEHVQQIDIKATDILVQLEQFESGLQEILNVIPANDENLITTQIRNKLHKETERIEQDIENIKSMPDLLARIQHIEEDVQQIDIKTSDVLNQLGQFEGELQTIKAEIPIDNGSTITTQIIDKLHERTERIGRNIENIKAIVSLTLQTQVNKKKMIISISLALVFILIDLFSVFVITNSQLNFVQISLFDMISNKLLLAVSSTACALFTIATVVAGIYIHNIIELNNQNNFDINQKQNLPTQNETRDKNLMPDPSELVDQPEIV